MSETTEFHCVMTIQSVWNGEPRAAATHAAVLRADSPAALYEEMLAQTKTVWHRYHSGRSMGTIAVMHWSCSPIKSSLAETPARDHSTDLDFDSDSDYMGADALAAWLVSNGYADERRGYGHVDGETLAEALLSRFTIIRRN